MNKRTKKILAVMMVVAASVLFSVSAAGYIKKRDVDIKEITRKVFPSVVKVEAMNGMRKVATGVVIDEKGYIVTTALVSPIGTDIFIKTSKGKKFGAHFIGMDPVTHLALVKAEGNEWKAVEWGEKKELESGSWISVVSISPEESPSVTEGIVSSVGRDHLRLNVCVIPGSSGSPVLNEKGQMVGLVRGVYSGQTTFDLQKESDTETSMKGGSLSLSIVGTPVSGLAVAVPVDVVKKVTTEIKEKGKVQRGWLGVSIIENQDGEVKVIDVDEKSPAESSGLKEGDVILEFDGEPVTSTHMLGHEIRMHKPGDRVKVVIRRDQESKDIKVKLGEYSRKSIMAEFKEKFPLLFSPDRFKLEKVTKPEQWTSSFIDRKRNYIGVYLEEINRDLSEYFGVSQGTGLLVTKIVKDGPAEKAGLKVGDVIIRADGKRIETMRDIQERIQKKKKDESLILEVLRDKKMKEIELKVEQEEKDFPFISKITNISHFQDKVSERSEEIRNTLLQEMIKYRCIEV